MIRIALLLLLRIALLWRITSLIRGVTLVLRIPVALLLGVRIRGIGSNGIALRIGLRVRIARGDHG